MSTLSGSIEGARGSPVEVHEYLASNLHPGRCQVCAPFLMLVNGAIALKTTVTETQVGASKPVLPTKPERRPRDRASAPRVCRGVASAVPGRRQAGARENPRRVLSPDGL